MSLKNIKKKKKKKKTLVLRFGWFAGVEVLKSRRRKMTRGFSLFLGIASPLYLC